MGVSYFHKFIINAKYNDRLSSINNHPCYIITLNYSKTAPNLVVSACLKHHNIDYHNCNLGR